MYVYIQSTANTDTFQVGHYNPIGEFVFESEWEDLEEAAARASYLNGGVDNTDKKKNTAKIEKFVSILMETAMRYQMESTPDSNTDSNN